MTKLDDLARAITSQGFDFLRWSDWHPEHPPSDDWTKLHLQGFPAARHWVHHSVTPASASPIQAARTINHIGIERFGKMSYPFLIHASGTIIQGCYPYIGAHTLNYNSTSLAGCNIGDYDRFRPPQRMVDANIALIRALRTTGHYSTRDATPIYGHQQSPSASTACPGQYLMAWLPHIRRVGNLPIPTPDPGDDDLTPDESKKLSAVDLRTQALITKTDEQQKDLDAINLRLIALEQQTAKILAEVTKP